MYIVTTQPSAILWISGLRSSILTTVKVVWLTAFEGALITISYSPPGNGYQVGLNLRKSAGQTNQNTLKNNEIRTFSVDHLKI